eukprot:gene5544-5960_t
MILKRFRIQTITFACIITILLVRILFYTSYLSSSFPFSSDSSFDDKVQANLAKNALIQHNGTAFSYLKRYQANRPSNPLGNQNHAYATFMASKSYLAALEVFLSSFVSVKPNYPLIITIPLIADYLELVAMVDRIAIKYKDELSYEIYLLPLVPSPERGGERDRWKINWTKLQIWTMVAFDKLFYFDVDVIFLQNVDDAFNKFPFQQFLGTYDWGRWSPMGTKKMNGGVFLAQPSMQTFQELCDRRNFVDTYRAIEAEQGLFNHVYLEKQCCLPIFYNVQKTVQSHIPQLWHRESVFVLHFTGEKPWLSWSSSKFRDTFVPEKEKQELRDLDHFDANDYEELHTLWKDYYIKGRRGELSQLTIFQSYEKDWDQVISPPSLSSVYRFVRLIGNDSLNNRNNHFNAVEFYPKLINSAFQKGVGEFGNLLAVSRLKQNNLTSFVGFSPSHQKDYSDGKEGASLDWTKVDFQPRTIYFWHAVPVTTSYAEFIDQRFPGVKPILIELCRFSKTLLPSNSNYHIKIPSFITTKDVFIDLMKDASSLLEKLEKGCKRCTYKPNLLNNLSIETIMEVYFNVWIRTKKLNLIYAIDNISWRGFNTTLI